MTYASWEPRYRVTTIAPGKLDLFAVTFFDGKLADWRPVTEYDAALKAAQEVQRGRQHQIKVLAVSGREMMNLLGISPSATPQPFDPADRRAIVERLMRTARDSADMDARSDAFDLLKEMGVIQP